MRKRILAIVLAFILAAAPVVEVSATEATGTMGFTATDIYTETVSGNDAEPVEKVSNATKEELNDPLYRKYMHGINLYTTVSSAEEITHDSRFEKFSKIMGIDVSKWQADIDWKAVKNDGIDFAIIRLGYRGTLEGEIYLDSYFAQNMVGAHNAEVAIGAYFFTQAITVEEAEEEATYMVKQLEPYRDYVTYPVMIDIEAYENSRLDAALLSPEEKTEICKAFCEVIEEAGYTAGVYSNKYYWENYLNAEELDDYYVWMAHYTDKTSYAGHYDMWQFSSTGSVNGISGNVDLDVAYVPMVPETPGKFQVSSVNNTSVNLEWKPVKIADGYRVYCYDSSGKSVGSKYTTANKFTYSGLDSGRVYEFKVRAYYELNGEKNWGAYSTALRTATKPEQVAGVKMTAVATESVSLSWTKQKHVTGYRVYCYDKSGKQLGIKDTTSNSLKYTGLGSGVTYQFKVRAYADLDGTKVLGNFSGAAKVTTKPAQVKNLRLNSSTTNKLVVRWAKVTGAEGYKVSLYNGATGKSKVLGTTTKNSYTIDKLEAGTPYSVKVSAYVKNGSKEYAGSYSKELQTATKPEKVTDVKLKAVNAKSLKLSWTKQSNVSGYRVYCYNASGKALGSQYTTTNSISYTGLKQGVKYQFKVRACVKVGETEVLGNESSAIKATTKPAKVTGLKMGSVSTNKFTVKWTAVTGAAGYKISLYNEKTGKTTQLGTTKKTTYTVKNMETASKYSVKVTAYVENNGKQYAGTAATIKTATKPEQVVGLKQKVKNGKITLSWKVQKGVSGYGIDCYNAAGKKVKSITSTKRNCTIKGLTPGNYSFKVRSYVEADDYTAWGKYSTPVQTVVE